MENSISFLSSQLGVLSVKLARMFHHSLNFSHTENPEPSEETLSEQDISQPSTPAVSPEPQSFDATEVSNDLHVSEETTESDVVENTEETPDEATSFAPLLPFQFQLPPLPVEEESSSSSEEEEEPEPEIDLTPYNNEIAAHTAKLQELQHKKVQSEMERKIKIESLNSKHLLISTQLDSAQNALQQLRGVIEQYQLTSLKNQAEKQRLQNEIQSTINRINGEIQEVRDKFARDKKKTETEFRAKIDSVNSSTASTTKVNEDLARQIAELREISRKHQENIDGLQIKSNDAEAVRRQLCNDIQDLKGNIRVLCSVRPHPEDCDSEVINFTYSDDATEFSFAVDQPQKFKFDAILSPNESLSPLYEEISPLVESTLTGRNCTLLVYGFSGRQFLVHPIN